MLLLFAVLLTTGALLFHTLGFSIQTIAFISLALFIFSVLVFRNKKGIVFGLGMGLSLCLGAYALFRIPLREPVTGNRAFVGKVVSVSGGGERNTLVIEDETGVRYRTTTEAPFLSGDIVSVRGKVELPEDFLTDQGRMFPYQAYLLARGINATLSFPTLTLTQKGDWSLARMLEIVQEKLTTLFSLHIRYPFDTVVSGMVLGIQGGVPENIKNLFRDTGVLHTLVLSGYNITLVAGMLGLLLRGVSVKLRTVASVVGIVFLVGISGAGVAALRAGIMGSLSLLALATRRSYDPFRGLILAYVFFFFLSPLYIFSDPGFHLSFIATGAIIMLYPRVEEKIVHAKTKFWRGLQSIFLLSTFMPLIMLPYFMYFSGTFALSSPLSNIFASVFVPVITVGGMILLALSFSMPLAGYIGILIGGVVSFFLFLLRVFSHIPVIGTAPLPWWGVLMVYSVLICMFFQKTMFTFFTELRQKLS